MIFPERIVVGTRNAGKVREILAICRHWPVAWVTDASWPPVEETGTTYLENARRKAHAVAEATGQVALGEDSGIEVDALGGAPGPRSARFAGEDASDRKNLEALLGAIREVPGPERIARYRAVAVMAWPDGREVIAEGTCQGVLTGSARGRGGFGYDPIFIPLGFDRTMAELDPEEKNRISHRGEALRGLRRALEATA